MQNEIQIKLGKPRKHDIEQSVANTQKFNKYFSWKPKYNDLRIILKTSLEWDKNKFF